MARISKSIVARPGTPGTSNLNDATINAAATTLTAARVRTDPGVAGVNRQTIRISGGVPRWRDSPNFFGRDYVTGVAGENASSGLALAVADMKGTVGPVGVQGGNLQLEQGEYRLTETLDLTRFTGRIGGSGPAISPSYATSPGRATVLIWDGPADVPMIRVRNSRDVIFEGLRLEGHSTNYPSYGIEFNAESGEGAGTNAALVVRDVNIGWYSWPTTYSNRKVKRGIGFTGVNVNNDQFRIERVWVRNPTEYGLYVLNSQSVGGTARNLIVTGAGIAGVSTGASIHLADPEFYGCAIDVEVTGNNAMVLITNWNSEDSLMLARMSPASMLAAKGGHVQVGEIITGGGVMVDWAPTGIGFLSLEDMIFTENTVPASARIVIGSNSTAPNNQVENFMLNVERCVNLHPDQLVLDPGAMWAGSPMSKGTIEWQSYYGNQLYQFRNELRQSGVGSRTTLNRTAWDMPLSGLGTLTTQVPGIFRLAPQAAPASGVVGDMYMTTVGKLMVCTVAGTPGTWIVVGTQT